MRVLKAIGFVVLGFLEVVFLSLVFSSSLPRRSADLESFWTYQKATTRENHEAWMKERQITLSEVRWTKFAGGTLAIGNLLLMGWLARKRPTQLASESSTSAINP